MRTWVSLPALLLALSVPGVLAASSAQAAAGVHADTTASLPITSFGRIVADTAHGHLFLSSSSQNEILVTDLAGQQVATITGQDGVLGMALSPDGSTLYAALSADNAVSAIDTATLQQTASYPLGSGNTPRDVAVQSGKVWVSYSNGTGGWPGAVGDINVGAASPAFQTQAAMGGWYSAPDLAADPQDTGVLIAAQPGISPTSVTSYNVSADPATVTAQSSYFQNCGNENDIAVAPGGSEFTLACGWPYNHYRYSTADLHQLGFYPTTSYPDAVALDTSGDAAAGLDNIYGPDLYIYHADSTTSLNVFTLPGSSTDFTVARRGLAWAPDGSKLFVVLGSIANSPGSYSLQVIDNPTFTRSALTLTGPSAADITKPVTLTGKLTLGGITPPAGTAITVTRWVSGGPDQTFTLTTAADGSYTLTDTPPAVGQYTYTASYSGDANTASAAATQTVNVTLIPSKLQITESPSTSYITAPVTMTGYLALDGAPPPAGTAITVTRSVSGGPDQTFSLTPAADGSFTFTDDPPAPGEYTYTFSYSGDANTVPAATTQSVDFTLDPAPLTLTTGATYYTYQPTVTVTAHLGTTASNRTVSIYAQPAGGSKTLLKTGTVDASGNLAVSYTAPHNTTFSAVFSGDQDYAPATVTQDVYVRAKVSESISGYYGKTSIGGTTYRLYHHTALLKASATVTPSQSGQCVQFEVQEYYQGAWQANVTTGCKSLSSTSKASASFGLTQADLGYHYRIRADFLGDLANASNSSAWQYLIVKK